jgi:hypothetical protein
MGDRISISFTTDPASGPFNGVEKSVILYFHWGGRGFLNVVKAYLKEIGPIPERGGSSDPFSRRDPWSMVVHFIEWLIRNGHPAPDCIFDSPDEDDDGPGDAGLWIVNFADNSMKRFEPSSSTSNDAKSESVKGDE